MKILKIIMMVSLISLSSTFANDESLYEEECLFPENTLDLITLDFALEDEYLKLRENENNYDNEDCPLVANKVIVDMAKKAFESTVISEGIKETVKIIRDNAPKVGKAVNDWGNRRSSFARAQKDKTIWNPENRTNKDKVTEKKVEDKKE